MAELAMLDAVALSEQLQARKLSPVALAEELFDRIGRLNPKLNAFVTLSQESALEEARQAEADLRAGRSRGPLHGLPLAHKDLYATKGLRTTGGSKQLIDWVPAEDATSVARLRSAGTVLMGKLNTHEFAYGPTNEISCFGPSRNAWNPECITGGSSGGSGAAVAAGLVPLATGSDTGGSIRIPAACCGISGLKPTYGLVSRHGVLPLCWSLDHAGPMARSARDCALMLDAMAGHDPDDDASAKREKTDYLRALDGEVGGLRIGVPRDYFFQPADPAVVSSVEAALRELEKRGARLVSLEIEDIAHAAPAAFVIYLSEATAWHEDTMDRTPELYDPAVRSFLEMGDQILAKDYLLAQRYRSHLGRRLARCFEQVDLLAMPTLPTTATPFGAGTVDLGATEVPLFGALLRNCEPFNLTGLPALSVPCGFVQGLPVGLQLVGPAFADALVLNAGHAYQQATDWHRQRPPIS
ncbi:MAG TPA: amidase [Kiloniellales bacterium]|nr:amidase [Kiloniellales bacterium]